LDIVAKGIYLALIPLYLIVKSEEVFHMSKVKENEWRGNPFVILAGILVLYTASNSIITLFNL
jgi:hypothetical protein